MSFVGKVAIVTGASSGIGRATASLLAHQGACVALVGRNVDNLNKTLDSFEDREKGFSIIADLSNENETITVVQKTFDKFGKIDILVNNAGIIEAGTIETTDLDQYDRVMNINVRSLYQLTMLAVPYLVKTKGNIVNVSSVNGVRSFPGVLAYCISKSAVDQMTRCVALELAPKGVRCNSVNPGVILTELQKRSGMDDATYAAFLERSKTTHALGRVGEPSEVAEAIAYLASNSAGFVTGVQLPVDGGRHALCPR